MPEAEEQSSSQEQPRQFVFKRTPQFRKSFGELGEGQQRVARSAYQEWKTDPLNRESAFRPHKINKLSSRYRTTVYGITLGNDFRVTFMVNGNEIISLDIGTHEIYE